MMINAVTTPIKSKMKLSATGKIVCESGSVIDANSENSTYNEKGDWNMGYIQ